MLVLTRKLGEGLMLGNDISLKILEIHKNQVKLGIEAPEEVRIYRDEVYQQIIKENLLATATGKEEVTEVAGRFRNLFIKVRE